MPNLTNVIQVNDTTYKMRLGGTIVLATYYATIRHCSISNACASALEAKDANINYKNDNWKLQYLEKHSSDYTIHLSK